MTRSSCCCCCCSSSLEPRAAGDPLERAGAHYHGNTAELGLIACDAELVCSWQATLTYKRRYGGGMSHEHNLVARRSWRPLLLRVCACDASALMRVLCSGVAVTNGAKDLPVRTPEPTGGKTQRVKVCGVPVLCPPACILSSSSRWFARASAWAEQFWGEPCCRLGSGALALATCACSSTDRGAEGPCCEAYAGVVVAGVCEWRIAARRGEQRGVRGGTSHT